MHIAQVSPLEESVPPRTYGGTERIIAYLTEELIHLGHEVTLFASGDSRSSARLIAPCQQALRFDTDCQDKLALHIVELKNLLDHAQEFDIIHFHTDYLHFPLLSRLEKPNLTTLHGRQDIRELKFIHDAFPHVPLVSISDAQRRPIPHAHWIGTVHHGLPRHLFHFHPKPKRYLAFLGRVSREKGLDRAIEIAKACQIPLKIAAKVDNNDRAYFESEIRPLLDHPLLDFIGEINEQQKDDFLGEALALLFPIDWPEPFGLVMIEALACGTPVVAFREGSVPEVLRHAVSGFVVASIAEAIDAVKHIDSISRQRCRQEFLSRFTAEQMARNYLMLYERLILEYQSRPILHFMPGFSQASVHHL
jgi:glycosyltransferase involved in cell wall biosynthesis